MKILAKQWDVRPIPHALAVAAVRQWHYSGSTANTSVYRFGLFRVGLLEQCEGVTMWMPPTKPAGIAVAGDGWQGVLALSRLVCSPEAPGNAASFLLGRSMAQIDRRRWPTLVTYADTNQGHTGAIYRATNWTCDGPVAAGDVWVMPDGSMCGRKRGGTTLTVTQMRELGASRAPAAPKIRFRHEVNRPTSGNGQTPATTVGTQSGPLRACDAPGACHQFTEGTMTLSTLTDTVKTYGMDA